MFIHCGRALSLQSLSEKSLKKPETTEHAQAYGGRHDETLSLRLANSCDSSNEQDRRGKYQDLAKFNSDAKGKQIVDEQVSLQTKFN